MPYNASETPILPTRLPTLTPVLAWDIPRSESEYRLFLSVNSDKRQSHSLCNLIEMHPYLTEKTGKEHYSSVQQIKSYLEEDIDEEK